MKTFFKEMYLNVQLLLSSTYIIEIDHIKNGTGLLHYNPSQGIPRTDVHSKDLQTQLDQQNLL